MRCKIITAWGRSGSGKTTFAVNLALALAQRQFIVGIISSNLQYGNLQVFFNQSIREDKGIFQALESANGSVNDHFWKCGLHDNLFLLSVPNGYKGLLADGITGEAAEALLTQASVFFDFLIVDGSEEINNPLSSVALTLSSTIYTLHRPSISGCLWLRSMEDFILQLHLKDRMVHILSGHDGSCTVEDFLRITGLHYSQELPFVKAAPMLENAGTPIYLDGEKESRRYRRILESIADDLCG